MGSMDRIMMEAEEIARVGMREYAHSLSKFEWIDEYVVADGGKRGPIDFKLRGYQKEALEREYSGRVTQFLKARQIGITTTNQADDVWSIMNLEGFRSVVTSKDEAAAKEYIEGVEYMLRRLPEWMVDSPEVKRERQLRHEEVRYPWWSSNKGSVTVHQGRRSRSRIQAYSSGGTAARGKTPDKVVLDEFAFASNQEKTYASVFAGVEEAKGAIAIISTNEIGSYYEELWNDDSGREKVFYPWTVVPGRGADFRERMEKELGPALARIEYPATPEEALLAGESCFEEFDYERHTCEVFDVPEWWSWYVSIDPGYRDPYAMLVYAVDKEGVIYVIEEMTKEGRESVGYTSQGRLFSDVIESMKSKGRRTGSVKDLIRRRPYRCEFESEPMYAVIGRDAWNKGEAHGKTPSIVDNYIEAGFDVGVEKATMDRSRGTGAIHDYLLEGKVKIFRTCEHLIKEVRTAKPDPHNVEAYADVRSKGRHMDVLDSFRYGLVHNWNEKSEERKQAKRRRFDGVIDLADVRRREAAVGASSKYYARYY